MGMQAGAGATRAGGHAGNAPVPAAPQGTTSVPAPSSQRKQHPWPAAPGTARFQLPGSFKAASSALTGGPSSGGTTTRRLPPGFIVLMPSSKPARVVAAAARGQQRRRVVSHPPTHSPTHSSRSTSISSGGTAAAASWRAETETLGAQLPSCPAAQPCAAAHQLRTTHPPTHLE